MKFGRVGVLMKTQLVSFLIILSNKGQVIKEERLENVGILE